MTTSASYYPKPFIKNYKGLLLELEPDEPAERRLAENEVKALEKERGHSLLVRKFKEKFYIYKIR